MSNHIANLTAQRDDAQAALRDIGRDVLDALMYYRSDKFRWPDNDYAHVSTDLMPRLEALLHKIHLSTVSLERMV